MDQIREWFAHENSRWQKILSSPQQIEQAMTKRLDSDRLIFSKKLNQAQLTALRTSQTSEALRLQQLYQAIGGLERALKSQRAALTAHRNVRLIGKLARVPKPKIQRVAEKVAAAIQRRSIREQQSQLFKLKRQYRALHQRYTRLGQVLDSHDEGVMLFDETEKSHRLIWDLFLQMTDAARITLANHRTYDLSRVILVFTSNIGSQLLLRPTRLPFTTLERAVLAELHKIFRPELIGRFDEKIVFKPLSPDTQREIGRIVVFEELARLQQRGFELSISNEAFEFLIRQGIHKTLGARPMKRAVQKFIGDAISRRLKIEKAANGQICVDSLGNGLMIET